MLVSMMRRRPRRSTSWPANGAKIAIIGPFAEGKHDLNGPWVVYGDNAQAVDLAEGVRAVAGAANVTVTLGSKVEEPLRGGFEAAVAAANAADVVLLAIGLTTIGANCTRATSASTP